MKPKKKTVSMVVSSDYAKGYNKCWDEYEKFLPDEDEIYEILDKYVWCKTGRDKESESVRRVCNRKSAKVISNRMRSKK